MEIGISYTNYYMPLDYVSVEEILKEIEDFLLPKGYSDIGHYAKHYARTTNLGRIAIEKHQSEVDILSDLIEQMLAADVVEAVDVDVIIYTGGKPEKDGIIVPYHLQNKYGFKHSFIINLQHFCASTLLGMFIAQQLMIGGCVRNALVLSSNFLRSAGERFAEHTITGDGAGIMVLSAGFQDYRLIDFENITDGSLNSASYHETDQQHFAIITKNTVSCIKRLMARNKLRADDIKAIVPQNTNVVGWLLYLRLLGLPKEKVFLENIPRGGHLGDVDIIRNLSDLVASGRLAHGDNLILFSAGIGMSFNALYVKV